MIDMATIFDYMYVTPKTGTRKGGMGKRGLYFFDGCLMTEDLEFDSKPFTTLVRKIYQLFRSFNAHYWAADHKEMPSDYVTENVRKLESCSEIESLLREALDSEEWPIGCDKVEDQYPPVGLLSSQRKDTAALSYANHSLVPSNAPPGGKRRREEEDDPLAFNEAKRLKATLPL